MTEQELNKRIAEILGSTKNEPGCGRRSGRQYRRTQCVRHSDHLLFLIQHSRYAPNMGYIMGDYERLRTLLRNRQISLRIKRPPSQCLCIEMAACSSIMI